MNAQVTSEWTRLPSETGTMSMFVARPDTPGTHPGIVCFHALPGVNAKPPRDLPWRRPNTTPYEVLIAELLLKRTTGGHAGRSARAWMNSTIGWWLRFPSPYFDSESLYQRVLVQQSTATTEVAPDIRATTAQMKALVKQEKALVAALRNAPSAADSISTELEKVARERKQLEHALQAEEKVQVGSDCVNASPDAIKAFSVAVAGRLSTMDTEELHRLLSVLGFEAIVDANGKVQASIAVPVTPTNYLPLHEHGHDHMDIVVAVHGPDHAGA
jgi:hypothetical protein